MNCEHVGYVSLCQHDLGASTALHGLVCVYVCPSAWQISLPHSYSRVRPALSVLRGRTFILSLSLSLSSLFLALALLPISPFLSSSSISSLFPPLSPSSLLSSLTLSLSIRTERGRLIHSEWRNVVRGKRERRRHSAHSQGALILIYRKRNRRTDWDISLCTNWYICSTFSKGLKEFLSNFTTVGFLQVKCDFPPLFLLNVGSL